MEKHVLTERIVKNKLNYGLQLRHGIGNTLNGVTTH